MQSPESNLLDERRRLERKLLEKLKAAEHDYRSAAADFKSLSEQSKDLGLAHPDGRQAIRNAVASERAAMQKYQAALRAFTDFVVSGIMPPSDE